HAAAQARGERAAGTPGEYGVVECWRRSRTPAEPRGVIALRGARDRVHRDTSGPRAASFHVLMYPVTDRNARAGTADRAAARRSMLDSDAARDGHLAP